MNPTNSLIRSYTSSEYLFLDAIRCICLIFELIESQLKIIFSASPDAFVEEDTSSNEGNGGISDLLGGLGDLLPPGLDPSAFAGKSKEDIMKMGKDLMANMSQEEQAEMFQKFMSMPEEQSEKLMGKAKDMNLF